MCTNIVWTDLICHDCLERVLILDLIRAMAGHNPMRVVCLDGGFAGNDQRKANAVQLFKTKGITSFKTV